MLIVEPSDELSSSKSDEEATAPGCLIDYVTNDIQSSSSESSHSRLNLTSKYSATALPIDDEPYDADEETDNGNGKVERPSAYTCAL